MWQIPAVDPQAWGSGFLHRWIRECRRFCVGRSITDQQRSTMARGSAATHSTPITCGLQISIEFNNCRNLVRDQGGRRFKSSFPDQSFQAVTIVANRAPGFGPSSLGRLTRMNTARHQPSTPQRSLQNRLQSASVVTITYWGLLKTVESRGLLAGVSRAQPSMSVMAFFPNHSNQPRTP